MGSSEDHVDYDFESKKLTVRNIWGLYRGRAPESDEALKTDVVMYSFRLAIGI